MLCKYFQYCISVEQNVNDASEAIITREIYPLVSLNDLPPEFDSIFAVGIDELIIPIKGSLDFDELVSKFENLQEQEGGEVSDNALKGVIEYITEGKTSILVDARSNELIITNYYPMKAMELIRNALSDIKQLSLSQGKLLE